MELWEFVKEIDFFGKEPEFYFKGRPKQATIFGRICTYIFMIIYITIFCYKFYRMTRRVDITFYDSYSNTDQVPMVKISQNNFTLVFTLLDEDGDPFIDDTIYYPEAYYYDNDYQEVKIERCDPSKLSQEFLEYFDYKDIDSYFCLTDIDYELRPFMNTLRIEIYPCIDASEEDDYCESREFIESYMSNLLFMIYFEDINLTPLNFDSPVKKKINSLNTEIFTGLGQYLYSQMQVVKIETGTNIIGFDFLTEPKIQDFIKFDKEVILPFPGYDPTDVDNTYPASIFELQLNDRILLEKRSYVQLIDVLGEIGGFMEIMSSLFAMICSLVADMIYEKRVSNSLFTFDIQKKLISIKNSQNPSPTINENIDEIDEINIYEPNLVTSTNKKIQSKEKKIISKSRSKNLRNKKDSVLKSDTIEVKSFKRNTKVENFDRQSIKNSREEINKNSEEYLKDVTIKKKKTVKFEDNSYIISDINLKDLLVSKCCSCFSRKKNVYKVILKESSNIIKEKLDILNIFRTIYIIEYSSDLNKNIDKLKMSKECTDDLIDIIK